MTNVNSDRLGNFKFICKDKVYSVTGESQQKALDNLINLYKLNPNQIKSYSGVKESLKITFNSPVKKEESLNLFAKLIKLRHDISIMEKIHPYRIIKTNIIRKIAEDKPKTKNSFLKIKGIKPSFMDKYGNKFLEIINEPTPNIEKRSYSSNKELFEKLRILRLQLAKKEHSAAYFIFSDKTLSELAITKPTTYPELIQIKGIKKEKLEKYGEILLNEIITYLKSKNEFRFKK